MLFRLPRPYAAILILLPSSLPAFSGGNGTRDDPFQITTAVQLDSIRYYLGEDDSMTHFKLMNDIDLKTWLSSGNPGYNNGAFWLPIGNQSFTNDSCFHGKLDGNNYKIRGLKINRTEANYIGLFGAICSGKLQNIGIEIANGDTVKGNGWVGGLVGSNSGTVSNCSASGVVSGKDISVGGLVGENYGSVSNCSASCVVGGRDRVGGLFGSFFGTISNCSASGAVSGNNYVGGLIGFNHDEATVTNSCWDKQTTHQSTSAGSDSSFGRTTVQMKTQSAFAGWNFDTTWAIASGKNNGYPYLQWQQFTSSCPGATLQRRFDITFTANPISRNVMIFLPVHFPGADLLFFDLSGRIIDKIFGVTSTSVVWKPKSAARFYIMMVKRGNEKYVKKVIL